MLDVARGERTMKKKRSPIDKFLSLTDAEKDAEVAKFDREIPLSETRALNAGERKQWRRVKRALGRPVVGEGAQQVAVTLERKLLRRVDEYAKQHKLKRSQLIAEGLQLILARKAG
jgi:hypothetical protein